MGCIGWSASIVDATVIGCYLEGGIAGIGGIDDNTNNDITISDCTIRNSTTAGINLPCGTANNTPSRILIADCRIYDCPSGIEINESQVSTTYPSYISINGCQIYNSTNYSISINQAQYITITGGILYSPGTSILHINISALQYVTINDVLVQGGGYGVYCQPGNSNPDSIAVANCMFLGQHGAAVYYNDNQTNSTISGNTIKMTDATNTGYNGIVCFGPTVVSNNTINIAAGTGIESLSSKASGALVGALVQNNRITGSGTSIQPFGDGGNVYMGNVSATGTPLGNTGPLGTTLPVLTYTGTTTGGVLQTGTAAITINTAGAGFPDGTPALIFVGGGGSGAAGTATISGGVVTATNITNGGTGFTGTPKVYVTCSIGINNVTA